jgi:two-component system chemotaxis response regulator CheB
MPNRDIIVMGASAGGIQAVVQVLDALPSDVAATVFVVVHTSPESGGLIPTIFERGSRWRAAYARDGQRFTHGRVYVAPADHHLLVKRGTMRVVRGPRENRFRPAVDPLFRTASVAYGPRVIGVVLSGGLDDGTHGLELIKQHGGIAIAQDPEEATTPNMPLNAIQNVEVDYVLKSRSIGLKLQQLTTDVVDEPPHAIRTTRKDRADVAEGGSKTKQFVSGPPSEYTCPECGGTLWELNGGRILRYRCHVGHGYTAQSLSADQSDGLDNVLWSALRALEEHSMLRRRMAEHAHTIGQAVSARQLEREAKASEVRAGTIRRLLQAERPVAAHPDALAARKSRRSKEKTRPGTRTRRVNS